MSEPTSRHDVVVVGARAAGAATALLLARAGLDVLVVDRSRYGADTLSTHALMRAGVIQLHRWGLLDAVIARRHARRCGRRRSPTPAPPCRVPVKPRHGVDALYAPRRTVLDPILVDAARAAGASVRVRHDRHRRDPRRHGSGGRRRGPRRRRAGRSATPPAGWSAPTGSARPSPTPSARRSSGRAPPPPPSSTATGRGSRTTGTSGSSGRRPAPGASPPTTARRACSLGGTPDRVGRGGIDVLHELARTASPALAYELRTAPPPSGCAPSAADPRLPAGAVGPGMGSRRRRRLLEGPDQRPRPDRRAARRRAARPGHRRRGARRGHRGRRLRRLPPHAQRARRCTCSTSSTPSPACAGARPRSSTCCRA